MPCTCCAHPLRLLCAVKLRMRSVQNLEKITKAMKMVAASKMRSAQIQTENSRGIVVPMYKLLGDLPGEPGSPPAKRVSHQWGEQPGRACMANGGGGMVIPAQRAQHGGLRPGWIARLVGTRPRSVLLTDLERP